MIPSINSLINNIYNNIDKIIADDDQYCRDRTILGFCNANVDSSNKEILHFFLDVHYIFWSIDLNIVEAGVDTRATYPSKYLIH